MAQLTRTNPVIDAEPGFFFGHNPVNIYEIDTNANLFYQTGPIDTANGALASLVQIIESQATIEVLGQFGTLNLIGNNGNVSSPWGAIRVIVSGPAAWPNAATLQTAIQSANLQAANSQINVTFANANVYSVTF
jgi:hypothetical protein